MPSKFVYENASSKARLTITMYNGRMVGCVLEKNGKVFARNHLVRRPTESDLYHDGWVKLNEDFSDN